MGDQFNGAISNSVVGGRGNSNLIINNVGQSEPKPSARESELNDRIEKARKALALKKEKERVQRSATEREKTSSHEASPSQVPRPLSPSADESFPPGYRNRPTGSNHVKDAARPPGALNRLQGSARVNTANGFANGSTTTSGSANPFSSIFALIIGINSYSAGTPSLGGAVNDAKAMQQFLTTTLGVTEDRIHALYNEAASRTRIIAGFKRLLTEPKIQKDDPILIYFAGHGAQVPAPAKWEIGGKDPKIQSLIPQDYNPKEGIHVIPDRTIATLLNHIAMAKGNNITVILDACHSSSGTRDAFNTITHRGMALRDVLPSGLDQDMWLKEETKTKAIPTGFAQKGLRSHVLIAACGESEKAQECDGRGLFSTALLQLWEGDGQLSRLTYSDILKKIEHIPGQNPQVEGFHRNRTIFSLNVPEPDDPAYEVRIKNNQYHLMAGAVQGIACDSEFTVYTDRGRHSELGILIVSQVHTSQSTMRLPEGAKKIELPQPGIAVQRLGSMDQALLITLSFDISSSSIPQSVRDAIYQLQRDHIILIVNDGEKAELQLDRNDNVLCFKILDKVVARYGLIHVPVGVPLTGESLIYFLPWASRFYWNLRRGTKQSRIEKGISISFLELEPSETYFDEVGDPILFPKGKDLLHNGLINIDVDDEAKTLYGIRIVNNSPWDLYPAVFYFDNKNWSVEEYYHPGTSGQFDADSPLQKDGSVLTIGYGSGGAKALQYELGRSNIDVGYLKIFLATKPIDLSGIQQPSPFTRSTVKPKLLVSDLWATITYPLVQRKR